MSTPILLGAKRDPSGRILALYPDPIYDAHAFFERPLKSVLREFGMRVTRDEYADSLHDLIEWCVRKEARFDAAICPSFAGWVASELRWRIIDLVPRKILGRNGTQIPFRSYEVLDDGDAERRLGALDSALAGDQGSLGGAESGGLPAYGTRGRAWGRSVLGLGANGRAAQRDPAPERTPAPARAA